MFQISSQEEFGLRFLLQLARQGNTEDSPLADIAKREGTSLTYVRKIFGILRRHGLVVATRGVFGGYALAKPAQEISLLEIFEALKPAHQNFDCAHYSGNLSVCANHGNCSVRSVIMFIQNNIEQLLGNLTLASLLSNEQALNTQLQSLQSA